MPRPRSPLSPSVDPAARSVLAGAERAKMDDAAIATACSVSVRTVQRWRAGELPMKTTEASALAARLGLRRLQLDAA